VQSGKPLLIIAEASSARRWPRLRSTTCTAGLCCEVTAVGHSADEGGSRASSSSTSPSTCSARRLAWPLEFQIADLAVSNRSGPVRGLQGTIFDRDLEGSGHTGTVDGTLDRCEDRSRGTEMISSKHALQSSLGQRLLRSTLPRRSTRPSRLRRRRRRSPIDRRAWRAPARCLGPPSASHPWQDSPNRSEGPALPHHWWRRFSPTFVLSG
jgi:hypothetical protein